ncbi:hypothetical protein D051_0316 [Vibrio parahaemolyticus VPCR-2010]|uniref:hypothetical protein n=1 Tax=Vibrio parahaemolyticus TaxID=670 RepID=UPI00038E6671|nr:hypothetical protein D051_0316 [Vibrio parahaemolyticus VPCR-2010]
MNEIESLQEFVMSEVYSTLYNTFSLDKLSKAIVESWIQSGDIEDEANREVYESELAKKDKDELVTICYELIFDNSANAEKISNGIFSSFKIDSLGKYIVDIDDNRKFNLTDRLWVVDMFVTGNSPIEVRAFYEDNPIEDPAVIVESKNEKLTLSDGKTIMKYDPIEGKFVFIQDEEVLEIEEKVKEQAKIFQKSLIDSILTKKSMEKFLDSNRVQVITL